MMRKTTNVIPSEGRRRRLESRDRNTKPVLRIVELYSGIGGVAEAVRGRAEVVLAVDQSPLAVQVYRANFDHPVLEKTLSSIADADIGAVEADLWWASPPCQPFTEKGRQRFLDDPRAATFIYLLEKVEKNRPRHFAFENVPGFRESPGRRMLLKALERSGYSEIREMEVCPTQFGIPNYRRRYFVVASRELLKAQKTASLPIKPLKLYLDDRPSMDLEVSADEQRRYERVIDLVSPEDPGAIAACFGSGYGRSISRSGSYLDLGEGRSRRFSPSEVLRLLGYSEGFQIPVELTKRQVWKLAGNSLSIPVVRYVLEAFPEYSREGEL